MIFDRSWYNRAGVERVMGFCTPEETERFLELVPGVEKAMVDSGIILIKYWLEVGADEQTRRLESRIDDPRKVWKLSDMDLKSYSRWYDYSRARDEMFARDRHRLGAVVRRGHRRQEARPAQHHHPPAQPDPLRAAGPARRRLPKRPAPSGYIEPELAAATHPDAVLTTRDRIRVASGEATPAQTSPYGGLAREIAMAVAVGFEPTEELPPHTLSRRAP